MHSENVHGSLAVRGLVLSKGKAEANGELLGNLAKGRAEDSEDRPFAVVTARISLRILRFGG